MRDGDWSTTSQSFEFWSIDFWVVVVTSWLVQILLAGIPGPIWASKFGPIVECCCRSWYPGIVVETTAATEDFATSVGFLYASIVWAIDHSSFVAPVIFATTSLESAS